MTTAPVAELSREEKLRIRREKAEAEKIAHVRETLAAARLRGHDALIEALFDFPPSKRGLATPEDLAFWQARPCRDEFDDEDEYDGDEV